MPRAHSALDSGVGVHAQCILFRFAFATARDCLQRRPADDDGESRRQRLSLRPGVEKVPREVGCSAEMMAEKRMLAERETMPEPEWKIRNL